MFERRLNRSDDPYVALCLQLEYARAHGALDAVVVAIDNGLLVAGAGESAVCEALGAVAPLADQSIDTGVMPPALDGQRIRVRALTLDGERLFIASAGRDECEVWLQRSVNGVRRILGESEAAPASPAQFVVN